GKRQPAVVDISDCNQPDTRQPERGARILLTPDSQAECGELDPLVRWNVLKLREFLPRGLLRLQQRRTGSRRAGRDLEKITPRSPGVHRLLAQRKAPAGGRAPKGV